MADLIVVYWRDIPAQVIVKKGRQNAKRELPLRFTRRSTCAPCAPAPAAPMIICRMAQG